MRLNVCHGCRQVGTPECQYCETCGDPMPWWVRAEAEVKTLRRAAQERVCDAEIAKAYAFLAKLTTANMIGLAVKDRQNGESAIAAVRRLVSDAWLFNGVVD